jgi:hypothetical protein
MRCAAGDAFSGTCVLAGDGGVRGGACATTWRPGGEPEGSTDSEGTLQAGADADKARELPGEPGCGGNPPAGVFGGEGATRMPSVLPDGVRDSICPVAVRPGEEPGAAREVPGELDGGTPCVFLGSKKATRRPSPSPDLECCRCAGVKGLVDRYCVRPLACISSASARIAFISTLQKPCRQLEP